MPEQSAKTGYNAIVTKDYAAEFADPITLTRGETAALDGREDPWEGNHDWIWVFGQNAAGKSGWIGRPVLRIEGSQGTKTGVALEDYDARELSVAAGERVAVSREMCGWAWCVADAHRAGWVPLSHLRRAS
jgi:hypothetical protein